MSPTQGCTTHGTCSLRPPALIRTHLNQDVALREQLQSFERRAVLPDQPLPPLDKLQGVKFEVGICIRTGIQWIRIPPAFKLSTCALQLEPPTGARHGAQPESCTPVSTCLRLNCICSGKSGQVVLLTFVSCHLFLVADDTADLDDVALHVVVQDLERLRRTCVMCERLAICETQIAS